MAKGDSYRKSMPASSDRASQATEEGRIWVLRDGEVEKVLARELSDADMAEVHDGLSQSRTPYSARAVIDVLWGEVKRLRILLERAMRRRRT